MSEADRRAFSSHKKKRGTTRASITRIHTRLRELPICPRHAQRLIAKLQTLSEEYKVHHFAVIDFIDDEEELATQQSKLDNLDDDVAQITARLEELAARRPPGVDKVDKVTFKRLRYLERAFTGVSDNLSSLDTGDNTCLLQQHQEHLQEELSDVQQAAEHEDTGEFDGMLDMLKGVHFTLSLQVRKMLRLVDSATPPPLIDTSVSKPTFDGNILNWTTFGNNMISPFTRPSCSREACVFEKEWKRKGFN